MLIPRPETEGLVDLVTNFAKDKSDLNILDVGTGSGNIIICLAKNLSRQAGSKFFASDVSLKAILVAKKNAKTHKVKITFADGNLLDPWANQTFDIIVANLPYLAKIVDDSTKHEPIGALVAAKKGLKLYEELFIQIKNSKSQPQAIFLEIGRDQGDPIKKLAKKLLPVYQTKIFKDLFGRPRYAQLVRKSS